MAIQFDNSNTGVITLSPPSSGTKSVTLSTTSFNRYMQIVAVANSAALVDGSDIIGQVEIPVSGTITAIRAKTSSGTCTVTFNINASSIGSVAATTSGVESSISASVSSNDDLTLDVSSASGSGLLVILTIEGS
jgi:hypothetical protein